MAIVSFSNYGSLFWGFYEAAEIRLIKKHLSGNIDVVELGASIGGVAVHIIRKVKKQSRFICVEANSLLIKTLESNFQRVGPNGKYPVIINKAINYERKEVFLQPGLNHTETRIVYQHTDSQNPQIVQTCKLSDIIQEFDIAQYDLVCDIEGAEIEMILKDGPAIKKCKNMFIEVHAMHLNGEDYSISRISELIKGIGFQLIERDGNVFYFRNTNLVIQSSS